MPKVLLGLTIAIAVMSGPVVADTTKTSGRTFEECHALAVSRGVHPRKRAERYEMLKGYGEKTEPKGLIARCMAGKPI